jgi:hypothetical protein
MLHFINTISDYLIDFIKDDPVRPEIPVEFRVTNGRFVAALVNENKPDAMVCVSFHDFVPKDTDDLNTVSTEPTTAVFYTIWSYKPGKGQELLIEAVQKIQEQFPNINRFVTLSPKTKLAERFHLKNGAIIFRENDNTINYEYLR